MVFIAIVDGFTPANPETGDIAGFPGFFKEILKKSHSQQLK